MFTINSGFIGDFKLGDNVNYNLEILALLYRLFDAGTDREKRLLCKPITLLLISIAEAVLYDLHQRVRRNTWEGVANLRADAIAYIRDRKIDKLAKYIASAKRHDFFDAADTGYYESLEILNRLRNRFHIQNEKKDFEPDESVAFNEARKTLAEHTLEKAMKTIARKYMRPNQPIMSRTSAFPGRSTFRKGPLAEPWANTSSALGKLMLTVLGGIAEFERDLIP